MTTKMFRGIKKSTKNNNEEVKEMKNNEIYEKAANICWVNCIPGRVKNNSGVYNAIVTTNGWLITHRDPKTGELWVENMSGKDGQTGRWISGDRVHIRGLQ